MFARSGLRFAGRVRENLHMHINLVWAPTLFASRGVSEQKMPLNICRHLFGGRQRKNRTEQPKTDSNNSINRAVSSSPLRGSVKSLKCVCVFALLGARPSARRRLGTDGYVQPFGWGLWHKLLVYVTTKMTVEWTNWHLDGRRAKVSNGWPNIWGKWAAGKVCSRLKMGLWEVNTKVSDG